MADPVVFRMDTDLEVAAGDWLVCRATWQHPERFWVVLNARLVKHRAPIPQARRYALTCQPVAGPTEDAPYLPEGFAEAEPDTVHLVEFLPRKPRARRR